MIEDFKRLLPLLLLTSFALLSSYQASAETNVRKQMRIRAAFIYQMSKFINWPIDKDKPLIFCMFPDSRAYNVHTVLSGLEAQGKLVSQGYKVRTKVLPFKGATEIEHYQDCALVYFNDNSDSQIPTALIKTLGRSKLLVGTNLNFVEKDGISALVYEGGKLKLYIHRDNYEASLIKIRSRLLSLAKFYPQ